MIPQASRNHGYFNSLPGKLAGDFNQTEYMSLIEKLDKERKERTMVSGSFYVP